MIKFVVAVQPSPNSRTGTTLYPPVAARLQSDNSIFDQLARYWAVATLVRYPNVTLDDRLGGRVFDSAHPMPVSTHGSSSSSHSGPGEDRAYFYFPDLVIREPGRYCIRISLLQMEYSSEDAAEGEAILRAYVDTDWIDVSDSPINQTRLSSSERRFLRKLKDDGQHIPSASI